ncbi:MAG TPA: hypothetical protein V6C72_11035 [Chroococcales cyanobacterium]
MAYQTAWTILQTLPVVPMRDSNQQSFEISSSIFIELMCRRSRETPARFHPSAEENSYTEDFDSQAGPGWSDGSAHGADPSAHCNARESSNEVVVEDITDAMQKASKDSLPLLPVNSATPEIDTVTESSKQEDFVYSLMPLHETSFAELQGASNLSSGELTSLLTMLEINGRITTVSPWRYRRTEQEPPKPGRALPVQTAIESGIDSDSSHVRGFSLFVKQNYHRISRKYLQIYLASYWFWIDREYWQIGSLFAACLRSRRISKDELMRYVSPRRVKMWLPAQAA